MKLTKGLTYCLRKRICAEDCGTDNDDDDEEEEDQEFFQDCPEGTTFCLVTRRCSRECSAEDDKQDLSDGNFINLFFSNSFNIAGQSLKFLNV